MTEHPVTYEQLQELETKLKSLDIIIGLAWALLVGAFGLGVWVATIQISINQHSVDIKKREVENTEHSVSIRSLELKDARNSRLLEEILEKLNKIEAKMEAK